MIDVKDIFNKDSINIFTDASILQIGRGQYIGAPGYVVIHEDDIIDSGVNVLANTTNNNSEIKAIRMGVFAATKYKDYPIIRIFSDSQLCVFGLRDRIYKWVNNVDKDGNVCGYNGLPIANQDVFLEIANYIVENKLSIQFFHQRGHINIANFDSVIRARDDFNKFNGVDSSIELVKKLSYYNNMVDYMTRKELTLQKPCIDACRFNVLNKIDIDGYYELTH